MEHYDTAKEITSVELDGVVRGGAVVRRSHVVVGRTVSP
jgi:hypothetical protein